MRIDQPGNEMDWASLSAFVAVADHGGFSAAAGQLHLTQPAISKRIALLEESLQARLFDSFARLGRGAGGEAAGLGLPLVRQFIEAHGGTVSLISEPGQGTAVTIELPRE